MKTLGVIPARFGSTRLKEKPLANINGHPMIEWVYKRSIKSNLDKVIVATDNEIIFEKVKSFGGMVEMTSPNHNTGTDRVAEVANKYNEYDVIINIQGDEPLIYPDMLNSLIDSFRQDENVLMATLKYAIKDENELNNPNVVKVITDNFNNALYFSRSLIPYPRNIDKNFTYFKHFGIYAYTKDFLMEFSKLKQTPLEKLESLEQLRLLENGYKIKVIETKYELKSVDTKEDLEAVEEVIKRNNITL